VARAGNDSGQTSDKAVPVFLDSGSSTPKDAVEGFGWRCPLQVRVHDGGEVWSSFHLAASRLPCRCAAWCFVSGSGVRKRTAVHTCMYLIDITDLTHMLLGQHSVGHGDINHNRLQAGGLVTGGASHVNLCTKRDLSVSHRMAGPTCSMLRGSFMYYWTAVWFLRASGGCLL